MKSIYNHRGTHNRTDFTGVTFNIMSKNVHDLEASVDGDCRTAVSAGALCPALSGRVPGRTPSHEVLLPNSFKPRTQQFPGQACSQHPVTERIQLLKTAKR